MNNQYKRTESKRYCIVLKRSSRSKLALPQEQTSISLIAKFVEIS